jgi:hypothetical protein
MFRLVFQPTTKKKPGFRFLSLLLDEPSISPNSRDFSGEEIFQNRYFTAQTFFNKLTERLG